MNKQKTTKSNGNVTLSTEETAELLGKATKVTSWLSALKQQTRRRPFLVKSEDGKFCVVLRDYRIDIQIARAYATLANHGLSVDPYVVKRITDASGVTLYTHTAPTNKVQVVSRNAADSTCAILEGGVKADDLKGFDGIKDETSPDIAKSLVPRRLTG